MRNLLREDLARGAVGIAHDVHAAVRSGGLAAAQVIIARDGGSTLGSVTDGVDAREVLQRGEGLLLTIGSAGGGLHEGAAAVSSGGTQTAQLGRHHLPRGQYGLHVVGGRQDGVHAQGVRRTCAGGPVFKAHQGRPEHKGGAFVSWVRQYRCRSRLGILRIAKLAPL